MFINTLLCQEKTDIFFFDQITGWVDKHCCVILSKMFDLVYYILI